MTLLETRHNQSQKLVVVLNKLDGAIKSGTDPEVIAGIAEEFFNLLNELPFDLLPYSAVSQFIYHNDSEDLLYFIEQLEEFINEKYDSTEDNNYKKGIKIVEHLELAQQQKEALFAKQQQKIDYVQNVQKLLMRKARKIEELQKTTEELQETATTLQEQNGKMVTNFISILGIFAAILMGAFGAIQSFSNIFDNAYLLSLGKLLIISSIGAASVLLILFFLLNGIAKLTQRSLSSDKNGNDSLTKKHPTIVISYGILTFVSLIGAALELSNIDIKFAWQGLWWLMPVIWIIYFIFCYSTKTWNPFKYDKKKNN